jgi:hypothetical protein
MTFDLFLMREIVVLAVKFKCGSLQQDNLQLLLTAAFAHLTTQGVCNLLLLSLLLHCFAIYPKSLVLLSSSILDEPRSDSPELAA